MFFHDAFGERETESIAVILLVVKKGLNNDSMVAMLIPWPLSATYKHQFTYLRVAMVADVLVRPVVRTLPVSSRSFFERLV